MTALLLTISSIIFIYVMYLIFSDKAKKRLKTVFSLTAILLLIGNIILTIH